MSIPEAVELLIADAPVSAHLATSVDDRPHVAPVWYGYRDGLVYFVTGGKKLANVRRNPRVSLSIEEADDGDVAWNVTLFGTATVVDDPERLERATDWIYDRYETDDSDSDGASDTDQTSDSETNAFGDPDGAASDGGSADDPSEESESALVEVRVRSAAWNVYE